jgi:hypothetical protein
LIERADDNSTSCELLLAPAWFLIALNRLPADSGSPTRIDRSLKAMTESLEGRANERPADRRALDLADPYAERRFPELRLVELGDG